MRSVSCTLVVGWFLALASPAAAQETLQLTFSTQDPGQTGWNCFSHQNVMAAWLEYDADGRYVRTIEVWGRTFIYNLEDWALASGYQIDGLTGATQICYSGEIWDRHDSTTPANDPDEGSDGCWYGTNCGTCSRQVMPSQLDTGAVDISDLPDGVYRVRMELSNCEVPNRQPNPFSSPDITFTFDKDGTGETVTPADAGPFTGITLVYDDGSRGSSFPGGVEAGPDIVINPSGAATRTASLNGLVTPVAATATWSVVSADPATGGVTFANANAAVTTATFSQSGIYVLQLESDHGGQASTDTLIAYVNAWDINAEADAQVTSNYGSRQFGVLISDGNGNRGNQAGCGGSDSQNRNRDYLRFDVSTVTGNVARAILRLPLGWFPDQSSGCNPGSGNFRDLWLLDDTDDGWVEASINWNNQPLQDSGRGIPEGDDVMVSSIDPNPIANNVYIPTWGEFDITVQDSFGDPAQQNNLMTFYLRTRPGDNQPCGMGFPTRENYLQSHLMVIEAWQDTPNQLPTSDAGNDQTVYDLDGDGLHDVNLNGTASSDPDGSIVAWRWSDASGALGTGSLYTATLPLGIHDITLEVEDSFGDINTNTDTNSMRAIVDDRLSASANDTAGGAVSRTAGAHDNLFAYLPGGDWYSIDLPAVGDITVDIRFTHTNGNLDLNLFQSDGTTAIDAGNSTSDDEQAAGTSLGVGTYLVQVVPVTGSPDANDYDLSIAISTTAPDLSVAFSPALAAEDANPATVGAGAGTVTASIPPASDLVVTLTPSSTDISIPATVTILGSQSSASFDVSWTDNALQDGDRAVTVTATAAGHLAGSATFTLVDDEAGVPLVSFEQQAQTVMEEDVLVVVNVVLSQAGSSQIVIPYTISGTATIGTDHDLTDGSLTIPSGNASGALLFNLVDDSDADGGETIVIAMGTPTGGLAGATTTHTVTVNDEETVIDPGGGPGEGDGPVVVEAGCACSGGGFAAPLFPLALLLLRRRRRR